MQQQGVKYHEGKTTTGTTYDTISQIHFCPACNNLMVFREDGSKCFWDCPVCKYSETFDVKKIIINDSKQYKPIDYSLYKHDRSLKRCHNKCPHCNEIQEVCIFYHENNSMKNGYVCTKCNNFYTNE